MQCIYYVTRSGISIQCTSNYLDASDYKKEKILTQDLNKEDVYYLTEQEEQGEAGSGMAC